MVDQHDLDAAAMAHALASLAEANQRIFSSLPPNNPAGPTPPQPRPPAEPPAKQLHQRLQQQEQLTREYAQHLHMKQAELEQLQQQHYLLSQEQEQEQERQYQQQQQPQPQQQQQQHQQPHEQDSAAAFSVPGEEWRGDQWSSDQWGANQWCSDQWRGDQWVGDSGKGKGYPSSGDKGKEKGSSSSSGPVAELRNKLLAARAAIDESLAVLDDRLPKKQRGERGGKYKHFYDNWYGCEPKGKGGGKGSNEKGYWQE